MYHHHQWLHQWLHQLMLWSGILSLARLTIAKCFVARVSPDGKFHYDWYQPGVVLSNKGTAASAATATEVAAMTTGAAVIDDYVFRWVDSITKRVEYSSSTNITYPLESCCHQMPGMQEDGHFNNCHLRRLWLVQGLL